MKILDSQLGPHPLGVWLAFLDDTFDEIRAVSADMRRADEEYVAIAVPDQVDVRLDFSDLRHEGRTTYRALRTSAAPAARLFSLPSAIS